MSKSKPKDPLSCSVLIKKLRLIETGEDDHLWASKIQKQWGQSPLTVRIRAGESTTLGSLTPQRLFAKSSSVSWEETMVPIHVPASLVKAPGMVMIEILSLPSSSAPQVLGMATFDLQEFLSSGLPEHHGTIHVMPSKAFTDITIHSVLDLVVIDLNSEQYREQQRQQQEENGGGSMTVTPGPQPSFTSPARDMSSSTSAAVSSSSISGNDRPYLDFPTSDLFFPLYLLEENTVVVSNVVTISSCRETLVVKLMCSDGEALKCFPVGGVTVQPNHRAYFSITFNPKVVRGIAGRTFSVEIVATVANDFTALPRHTLKVHLTPPTGNLLFKPYHYWVNGNCVSNRAINQRDIGFIRSVLPIYLMQIEDEPIIVTDRDTGEQKLISAGGQTSAIPVMDMSEPGSGPASPSHSSSNERTNYNSNGGGGAAATISSSRGLAEQGGRRSNGTSVPRGVRTRSPRLRGTIDLSNQKAVLSIRLGRIAGLPRPKPTDSNIGFSLSLEPCNPQLWIVQTGSSNLLQLGEGGDLICDHITLVAKKLVGKTPSKLLVLRLNEVMGDGKDVVPIAYTTISVPNLKSASVAFYPALPFPVSNNYSRWDEMESTGVAMLGASVKIVAERS